MAGTESEESAGNDQLLIKSVIQVVIPGVNVWVLMCIGLSYPQRLLLQVRVS